MRSPYSIILIHNLQCVFGIIFFRAMDLGMLLLMKFSVRLHQHDFFIIVSHELYSTSHRDYVKKRLCSYCIEHHKYCRTKLRCFFVIIFPIALSIRFKFHIKSDLDHWHKLFFLLHHDNSAIAMVLILEKNSMPSKVPIAFVLVNYKCAAHGRISM